jgi:hypothetical protein
MIGWVAWVELLKACWNVGGASLTGIHGYVRIKSRSVDGFIYHLPVQVSICVEYKWMNTI